MTSFKEINQVSATERAAWKWIRTYLRTNVAKGDTISIFNAVIRDMQKFLQGCGEIDDLEGLYQSIASEKVNDINSRFYLYG